MASSKRSAARGGRPSLSDDQARRIIGVMRRVCADQYEESQTQFGKALGVSQSAVSEWFASKAKPGLPTIQRFAEVSGIPIGELLDGRGQVVAIRPGRYPNRAKAIAAFGGQYADEHAKAAIAEVGSMKLRSARDLLFKEWIAELEDAMNRHRKGLKRGTPLEPDDDAPPIATEGR